MRDRILGEIRRLAHASGGKASGKQVFARQTGISEAQWSGVIWARWSDAIEEAGYAGNALQARFDTDDVLKHCVAACCHYGHLPTVAEFKLYHKSHREFPSKGVLSNHFDGRQAFLKALLQFAEKQPELSDITAMVRADTRSQLAISSSALGAMKRAEKRDGHVYLLKSGEHYKVGRSDELERRVKEIRVTLPEALNLVYSIRTDDAPGIEAYWHRQFADKRANGEWFRLTPSDIAAFKRRKFQ